MTQKLTILFDLDGTLVDTAPDLMAAHNHVMKKFGYNSKNIDEIRKYVGKGAAVMIGRSLWGQARKELSQITDQKIKNKMQNKESIYSLKTDMKNSKFKSGEKLIVSETSELPTYIQNNLNKYKQWLE